jgi:hypothetical protein
MPHQVTCCAERAIHDSSPICLLCLYSSGYRPTIGLVWRVRSPFAIDAGILYAQPSHLVFGQRGKDVKHYPQPRAIIIIVILLLLLLLLTIIIAITPPPIQVPDAWALQRIPNYEGQPVLTTVLMQVRGSDRRDTRR